MVKKIRQKEINEFKSELEHRKEKILGHLVKDQNGKVELQDYNERSDVKAKSDESAEEIVEFFTDVAVTESLEKTLKDINQALALIHKGNYGVCKYCGNEISIDRLKIRPVSTSCVKCKSQFTN